MDEVLDTIAEKAWNGERLTKKEAKERIFIPWPPSPTTAAWPCIPSQL